jgi:histidine ammonia-lyase
VADADAAATGGGLVISGGNFHGEPIALALDFAKLAVAELGAISERRIALLLDGRLNGGLPPFLAPASGLNSGMMMLQYTAAALASENKVLVHPASADSIPTSANQEDHVSMGATAARHARDVLDNVERILALELLVGAQALDLRRAAVAVTLGTPAGSAPAPAGSAPAPGTPAVAAALGAPAGVAPPPGLGVVEAHRRIRAVIARLDADREMGADIAAATRLVRTGALVDLVDG